MARQPQRDRMTEEVASNLIAQFMAAVEAEDLPEMERIVEAVCASPNIPFANEILRQLEC